ncbi:hypothetical protein [Paenibacillus crassostreae]|uniref:AAA domain-containing protein n=1 Tax=Paenibacillus crassostreae TaxID=1763538 RepID=A0A167DSH3_9BACL|nr:hypothetical protein [Paenibacillus crassostreae]AOZ91111.1 hypothetical protein LPB68_02080 [Paenibacillus crassostreae]OAB74729.1 hypothetical protein PNBC_11875 [Paenibacillus crassostreae]
MSTIAFWSPLLGGSGNTAHAAAVAAMIGLESRIRVLLGHGGVVGERLERAFHIGENSINQSIPTIHDFGMDALERLSLNRRLNKENIRDYTIPLIYEGLDFVTGNAKREGTLPGYRASILPTILACANKYYDLVLMDAGCGKDELDLRGDGAILNSADLIVISLTQNIQVLESFFAGRLLPTALQNKPYLIVLSRYDHDSHYNIHHIKRRFGYDGVIYGIPYSTAFFDAWNMGAVIPFMHRSRHNHSQKSALPFYESVRTLAKVIMENHNLCKSVELDQRNVI